MDPLIETMLNSSKQLTEDVRNLTKVVHELTISTKISAEMQTQNIERTERRLEDIEGWREDVDKHISSMAPVKDVVSGVRKAIVAALVGAIIGIVGYAVANSPVSWLPRQDTITKEK